jgi:uncharacterized membrane protein
MMNSAHLHLMINHFPMIGVVIGLLVLIAGYGFKKDQVKMTALGIFLFSALMSIAALQTGEGAEAVVESVGGISETLIHVHEEAAEIFFFLMLGLGLFSLITGIWEWRNIRLARYGYVLVLTAGLAAAAAASYTGTTGGEIRHAEIRKSLSRIDLPAGPDRKVAAEHDD